MGILLGALAGGARAYDEIANDHLAASAANNKRLIRGLKKYLNIWRKVKVNKNV